MLIKSAPDTLEKLTILSQDSQYDLSCACGTNQFDRRRRSREDKWIYPVTLPQGGVSYVFKTLVSNACVNDCAYCPLRAEADTRRCTAGADEIVKAFLSYYRAKKVFGLFLTSGVTGTPDRAMARLNQVARILRSREGFRGYIHLKVIPGASNAAVEESISLASAVSVNIEVPGEKHFRLLSGKKQYDNDIIRPLKLISRLTAKGEKFARVKQTTQFVVGASTETDREIVDYTGGLYRRLNLSRVYFSAYQRGLGKPDLPGERSVDSNDEMLLREHRLYQADFLLRKYGFNAAEIPSDKRGFLSLEQDPKAAWARMHPERFPVNLNRAGKWDLLRVPGLGPVTVSRILDMRRKGRRIRSLSQIGRMGKRLARASDFLCFG
jgi:predicted DNA-binding helix-hairpin-helix protein